MAEFKYITLREQSELLNIAAEWFHSKWGVPKEAYLQYKKSLSNIIHLSHRQIRIGNI